MIILGIETSCDETAAAIVTDKRQILSNIVLSQLQEHTAFGGVVPEIAARTHLENLDRVIAAALRHADTPLSSLSGIAVTSGPGLVGGLLVGTTMAKTIAAIHNIPFLAINHLEGHALTPRLTDDITFPYLLLLVSGGHTQILVVEDVAQYKRLGTTLDDAAGECFDKSAKLMSLPFPGGPNVEKSANNCRNTIEAIKRFPLPLPMKGRSGCDFSFSGLKTAVRQHVTNQFTEDDAPDLAFALQNAIAAILADRSRNAIQHFIKNYENKNPVLVIAGGVSANQTIRSILQQEANTHGFRLYAPPLNLCGDNAAMIAWAGVERLRLGLTDSLTAPARPRWPLDHNAPVRAGAGIKA